MSHTKNLSLRKVLAVFVLVVALAAEAFGQHLHTLSTFTGPNGSQPFGPLIADAKGNLYGATVFGGTGNQGVVFKLMRSGDGWVETVLHSFTGGDDGGGPVPPLAVDAAGNVFGAATYGGVNTNLGVVFEISPSASGWTETVLHSFQPGDPLAAPYAGVALDAGGNVYGTTTIAFNGFGGVYELSPMTGGGWHYMPIHIFQLHGQDGAYPYSTVTVDPHGVLYGVTEKGGAFDEGAVYALTPNSTGWKESVIYSFQGGADGEDPFGGVVEGAPGTLYGTTLLGGVNSLGTAFELSLSSGQWSEQVLYSFGSTGDATNPAGALAIDHSGNLFGATQFGGAYNRGTVFELTPGSGNWQEKVVFSFAASTNLNGVNAVLPDRADNLYGVGPGGAKNDGIVFEITP